ncbi:hypothetical protein [Photorhabdus viridis]
MSNPLVKDYFLTSVPAIASMVVQAGEGYASLEWLLSGTANLDQRR